MGDKGGMVEIRSREDLEQWLEDKPRDWAQTIALRAALRALPFISSASSEWLTTYAPTVLRSIAVAWCARSNPAHDIAESAYRAVCAAADASSYVTVTIDPVPNYEPAAAGSAAAAVSFATEACFAGIAPSAFSRDDATNHAGFAALYAADAASAAATYAASAVTFDDTAVTFSANATADAFWNAIDADCIWLINNPQDGARTLSTLSLWSRPPPSHFFAAWADLQQKMLAVDVTNSIWIEWFDRRIKGDSAFFDIPGDKDGQEDQKIQLQIVEATDQDFWSKGTNIVNDTLQGWLSEARARVAYLAQAPIDLDAIGAKLLESASPQARVIDKKLDAVPNALFDAPKYSDSLADIPSEMHAFLAVLEQSLPLNCPNIIRNCIKGYADELMVRGNRPIVNILTGMASAIAAQFWLIGPDADQQEPETWQVRHPEEWDNGTVDLFRTFFKKHRDLITHFPLNVEREELIAATPIDEVKASGAALLDPIQAVNDLIIGLNKDGLATDNIVRIMDAHLRYARDISGLPTPEQVDIGVTNVTPKRRFVLNSAGFYLHAFSILGTTVSLVESKQVAALVVQLYAAAQALLGFIL